MGRHRVEVIREQVVQVDVTVGERANMETIRKVAVERANAGFENLATLSKVTRTGRVWRHTDTGGLELVVSNVEGLDASPVEDQPAQPTAEEPDEDPIKKILDSGEMIHDSPDPSVPNPFADPNHPLRDLVGQRRPGAVIMDDVGGSSTPPSPRLDGKQDHPLDDSDHPLRDLVTTYDLSSPTFWDRIRELAAQSDLPDGWFPTIPESWGDDHDDDWDDEDEDWDDDPDEPVLSNREPDPPLEYLVNDINLRVATIEDQIHDLVGHAREIVGEFFRNKRVRDELQYGEKLTNIIAAVDRHDRLFEEVRQGAVAQTETTTKAVRILEQLDVWPEGFARAEDVMDLRHDVRFTRSDLDDLESQVRDLLGRIDGLSTELGRLQANHFKLQDSHHNHRHLGNYQPPSIP